MVENLLLCYKLMVKKKWIAKKELKLVDAWCKEF